MRTSLIFIVLFIHAHIYAAYTPQTEISGTVNVNIVSGSVNVSTSGTATAAKQDTQTTVLNSINTNTGSTLNLLTGSWDNLGNPIPGGAILFGAKDTSNSDVLAPLAVDGSGYLQTNDVNANSTLDTISSKLSGTLLTSGTSYVTNFPTSYPVTGTFWQSVQPVSLTGLTITSGTATVQQGTSPWIVSGTVGFTPNQSVLVTSGTISLNPNQQIQVTSATITNSLPTGSNTIGTVNVTSGTQVLLGTGSNSIGKLDSITKSIGVASGTITSITNSIGVASGTISLTSGTQVVLGSGSNTIGTVNLTSATQVVLGTGSNSIGQVTANAGTNLNTSTISGTVAINPNQLVNVALTSVSTAGTVSVSQTNILPNFTTTATVSAPNAANSSFVAKVSNTNRKGLQIMNTTDANCWFAFGSSVTSTTSTVYLLSGSGYYNMPYPIYTGQIQGICSATPTTGAVTVTEQ